MWNSVMNLKNYLYSKILSNPKLQKSLIYFKYIAPEETDFIDTY